MFELTKELEAQPVKTGTFKTKEGTKDYFEQILLMDNGYPFAMVHIDLFWPGRLQGQSKDKRYEIYDRLNEGERVKMQVTMEIMEDEHVP